MSSWSSNSSKQNVHHLHETPTPLNLTNPIRLAFLGGGKSGKTSVISKLTLGNFRDTYYPTLKPTPVLFNYEPESEEAVDVLVGATTLSNSKRVRLSSNHHYNPHSNGYYSVSSGGEISPMLVELVDTPAFNPQDIVPFIEASLYSRLSKEYLHNLANEPKKPVSTKPLIVASGASELNGNIDGYFLVYSAIPSYNPPIYDGDDSGSGGDLPRNHSFKLLSVMKSALNEAWQEYNAYKTNWEKGQEADVFSFKHAWRGLWRDHQHGSSGVGGSGSAMEDFSDSPPVWIVCTHASSPLASAQLLEDGKKLSCEWMCGFVAMDCSTDDGAILLPLMIRDIIQKRKSKK
ncbi:uncharacterized protein LODBEIA_P59790 [Lodderomyces beijingensis]|uniref:Uncharacterized protein n=1 Tax=Lodderomyces beijingensis TaxID=1775926 RepID=A0ABP0ZUD9_9ASCO